MLRRNFCCFVGDFFFFFCENFNPVKGNGKTNVKFLELGLWELYWWGLTSFGQLQRILVRDFDGNRTFPENANFKIKVARTLKFHKFC